MKLFDDIIISKIDLDRTSQNGKEICDLYQPLVEKRLKQNDYDVKIDESVKKLIAKKGIDANYGARPLRRAIQNYVEDVISEAILDGDVRNGKSVVIVADGEKCLVK